MPPFVTISSVAGMALLTQREIVKGLMEENPSKDWKSTSIEIEMIISAGVSSQERSSSLVDTIAKEPLRESLQTGRLPLRTSAFAMIYSN